MSGFYDEDDIDAEGSSPKDLRAALAKANKALKAKEDELAARDTTIAELTSKVQSVTLRDALSSAGVDPKYVRFAERDEVAATPEAIAAWVDENKEVYAFLNKPAAPAAAGGDEGEQAPEDVLDPDLVAGVLAGQQTEGAGRPSGSNTVISALEGADPNSFKSEAEIDAYIRGLGAPTG